MTAYPAVLVTGMSRKLVQGHPLSEVVDTLVSIALGADPSS
jgi:hypothetical protein